jgi:hypothetical protein
VKRTTDHNPDATQERSASATNGTSSAASTRTSYQSHACIRRYSKTDKQQNRPLDSFPLPRLSKQTSSCQYSAEKSSPGTCRVICDTSVALLRLLCWGNINSKSASAWTTNLRRTRHPRFRSPNKHLQRPFLGSW